MAAILGSLLPAMGGGGPYNVLVVVNDASGRSLELGQYYQDARNIPERNICHITTTTNYSIDTAGFTNQIRQPVLDYISSAGLSGQVDCIVFSMDIPYRVYLAGSNYNTNSLTGAMFYDYKNSPPPCSLPTATLSSYYEKELAFSHSDPETGEGLYYLSAMLSGWDLDQAMTLVDRASMADASHPTGTVYYIRTTDNARNVRWRQFEGAIFPVRFLDVPRSSEFLFGWDITGKEDVVGYMVGRWHPTRLEENTFLPGALGDHMTSYGGYLFDHPGTNRISILDWIEAGCAGTYGTVVEPCNYTSKFPQARVHYWYARGFSMGEAYTMSVQAPYQGILVGDPLCQPYARPPRVQVTGLATDEVVSGVVTVVVHAAAADNHRTVHRIDAYLDGLFYATLTNQAVRPGDRVTAVINGQSYSYTALPGDTLADVAAGLAANINDTGVTARASGDRVELVQKALGVSGTGITYSVSTTNILGGTPLLRGWTPGTNFAETTFPARQQVVAWGPVDSGDILRIVITRLDGLAFTNSVIADASDTSTTLLSRLCTAVNDDTNLQGCTGARMWFAGPTFNSLHTNEVAAFVESRTNTWEGYNLFIDYQVIGLSGDDYSGHPQSNSDVLGARGTIFLMEGTTALTAVLVLDTSGLENGPHQLGLVAQGGSAVRCQGRLCLPFAVSNSSLSCSILSPEPRKFFAWGSIVTVEVDASSSAGSVTGITLLVEGKTYAQTNAAPASFEWDTSEFGAGLVGLQARAWDTTGAAAVSTVRLVRIYTDRDSDQLPDWWEHEHFGSVTATTAEADWDGDGMNNLGEFISDSDPTDPASFLHVISVSYPSTGSPLTLYFPSSTQRLYNVFLNDGSLCGTQEWTAAESNAFWGDGGITEWQDDSVSTAAHRYYRVRAQTP